MDIKKAKNWYWWLWLSPLLTFPSLVFLVLLSAFVYDPGYEIVCRGIRTGCNQDLADWVTVLIAVLGASLWHLFLLIPAWDKNSAFVRWHGRQMLMLAGILALVPITFGILFGLDDELLGALFVMPVVWFFGNLWGHRQAARGECSMMRWFGDEADFSSTFMASGTAPASRENHSDSVADPEYLVRVIRYSTNSPARGKALLELEKLGLVEDF